MPLVTLAEANLAFGVTPLTETDMSRKLKPVSPGEMLAAEYAARAH